MATACLCGLPAAISVLMLLEMTFRLFPFMSGIFLYLVNDALAPLQ